MNQTFDLHRWWLLVSKPWHENRKRYTLSLVALAGLMLAWLIFVILMEGGRPLDDGMQATTYFVGLWLAGCLYASMLFTDLASKSKGINYLAVPASHLEKLLCAILYGVVIFFVCYTLIFYLVDLPMVSVANHFARIHWEKTHDTPIFHEGSVLNVFIMPHREGGGVPNAFALILLAYFAIQAAFVLGSIYFPKFSFIKTVIALVLICMFFGLFVGNVLHAILPPGNFYRGITGYNFITNGSDQGKVVELPDWVGNVLMFIFQYAFAPLFYVTAYFRLKEKEV